MTTGGDGPVPLFAGRFALGDLLGVGGSAAVYEAQDTAASDAAGGPRRVALKVLHQHLSADAALREAFLREARAAAGVRHPNVAAVLDAGGDDASGLPQAWIALELVAGGSLADRVATTGPMSPAETVAVLDGVLAALEAAHAGALVHRDVSPSNVLLARATGAGPAEAIDVRLTDFGLADATGRAARGRDVLRTDDEAGDDAGVIGNPHYMSPEQAQGRPVRAAGDLYQVGALGYFLLTGQPPYPRHSSADVLTAHVSAPPPVPSALVPAARPLDRIITHAMAKAPARRFRDAADFRAALAETTLAVAPPLRETSDGLGTASTTGAGLVAEVATGGAADHTTRVLEPDEQHYLGYLEPKGAPDEPVLRQPASSSVFAGVVAVLVLAAAVWGTVAAASPPGPEPTPSLTPAPTVSMPAVSTPTPDPTTDATEEPSSAPAPVLVDVPVLGGTLVDAQYALAQAGLGLGAVTQASSPEAADQVLGQHPAAGQQVESGSSVDLTVASGLNEVPDVAGMDPVAAATLLRAAGFTVAGVPTSVGTADGTLPAAGTTLPVGTTLTIVLVEPTPSPTPSLPPDTTPTPTPTPGPTPTETPTAPPQGQEP